MSSPAPPDIDPQRAALLVDAGQALLLDVREDDEWQAGRAPAAEHLPLAALDPSTVARDRPVIVVCRSGNRSGQAARVLVEGGHDARNLTGGMQAWAAAGLPVVRGDGEPGEVA